MTHRTRHRVSENSGSYCSFEKRISETKVPHGPVHHATRKFLLMHDSMNALSDLAYAALDRNVHERARAPGVKNLFRF